MDEAVPAAASLAHALGVIDAFFALMVVSCQSCEIGTSSAARRAYIHTALPATLEYVCLVMMISTCIRFFESILGNRAGKVQAQGIWTF